MFVLLVVGCGGETATTGAGLAKADPAIDRTPVRVPLVRLDSVPAAISSGAWRDRVSFADGSEVRRIEFEQLHWLTRVDARGRETLLPRLPQIGGPVPGSSPANPPCKPSAHRLVRASPAAAVALIMECNRATPLRLLRVAADGDTTVRMMAAVPDGFEPYESTVARDQTFVLAGTQRGVVAFARASSDGTWNVTETATAATIVAAAVTGADGEIWTWLPYELHRAGRPVLLTDRDGPTLTPLSLAVDPHHGVVVKVCRSTRDPRSDLVCDLEADGAFAGEGWLAERR